MRPSAAALTLSLLDSAERAAQRDLVRQRLALHGRGDDQVLVLGATAAAGREHHDADDDRARRLRPRRSTSSTMTSSVARGLQPRAAPAAPHSEKSGAVEDVLARRPLDLRRVAAAERKEPAVGSRAPARGSSSRDRSCSRATRGSPRSAARSARASGWPGPSAPLAAPAGCCCCAAHVLQHLHVRGIVRRRLGVVRRRAGR